MREKLNSQRGASLLIALLYFLVCGLVAAVIIGAAMTNVQKLKGARQRQQAYNSVSSAAQLIRDEMTRVEYQGMERWDEYECNRSAADIQDRRHKDTYSWEDFSASKEAGKSLTALLQDGVEKAYYSHADLHSGSPAGRPDGGLSHDLGQQRPGRRAGGEPDGEQLLPQGEISGRDRWTVPCGGH